MAAASFNPIRVQTHCQSPTAMQGRQHDCSRVRAMTDCKPLAKHWSVVTGCGRDVSVRLRIVRPMPCKEMKSKLVEDATGASAIGISIASQCSG